MIGDSGSPSNGEVSTLHELNLYDDDERPVTSSVSDGTRVCCALDDEDVHDVTGDASGEWRDFSKCKSCLLKKTMRRRPEAIGRYLYKI